jgi:hypothetical protein
MRTPSLVQRRKSRPLDVKGFTFSKLSRPFFSVAYMAYMAYMAYIFVFWPTLVVELTTFNTSCYAFATSLFPYQKSGTKSGPLKNNLDQVMT